MTEEKKPEYLLYEEVPSQGSQRSLNAFAVQGYEVVAVTAAGQDDLGRYLQLWTLRLRREQRTPANPPLLASVAASVVEWQERVEELGKLTHWLLSYHQTALDEVSRRLDLLEAWRRDSLRPDLHRLAVASGANEE